MPASRKKRRAERAGKRPFRYVKWSIGLIVVVLGVVLAYGLTNKSQEGYQDPVAAASLQIENHLSSLRQSWRDMKSTLPQFTIFEPPRPGVGLRTGTLIPNLTISAKHPVIMIPGVVTSKVSYSDYQSISDNTHCDLVGDLGRKTLLGGRFSPSVLGFLQDVGSYAAK